MSVSLQSLKIFLLLISSSHFANKNENEKCEAAIYVILPQP